ncbi:MAG: DUF4258 domain-containing protein [Rhodospirillales bacterium]|nr:DUF4258 domain-containing protein [Rhodospirillales bacterium]
MAGPTPFPLSRPRATAILREAARTGADVVFTHHAARRMRQRGILRTQVLRCLGRGRIVEGPAADLHGNWTCRVAGLAEGRALSVAVAIVLPEGVIVITAFWGE